MKGSRSHAVSASFIYVKCQTTPPGVRQVSKAQALPGSWRICVVVGEVQAKLSH